MTTARTPEHYPYSHVDLDGRPVCPICDHSILRAVYAVHWEAAHPAHSRLLRVVEWNPPMLDAWAGQGYPLPDGPAEPALTEPELRYLAETWTDTHGTFMDAVFDALGGIVHLEV